MQGQTCYFDVAGFMLQPSDVVVVLDTCGVSDPDDESEDGLIEGRTVGNQAVWDMLTLAGGQYRLCWCADGPNATQANPQGAARRCSLAEDFLVDMGELHVVGPVRELGPQYYGPP